MKQCFYCGMGGKTEDSVSVNDNLNGSVGFDCFLLNPRRHHFRWCSQVHTQKLSSDSRSNISYQHTTFKSHKQIAINWFALSGTKLHYHRTMAFCWQPMAHFDLRTVRFTSLPKEQNCDMIRGPPAQDDRLSEYLCLSSVRREQRLYIFYFWMPKLPQCFL